MNLKRSLCAAVLALGMLMPFAAQADYYILQPPTSNERSWVVQLLPDWLVSLF